jgi:hypothetical protein
MNANRAWPLAAALLLQGCALQQAGKSLGDGLMQAVSEKAPEISEGLLKGAGEGLRRDVLNTETQARINDTVERAVNVAMAGLPPLRDEMMGPRTQDQVKLMVETLLDSLEARSQRMERGILREAGAGLRQQILNDETQVRLNELLASLGTTARGQTQHMRDDLLGQDTNKQLQVIVGGAMGAVVKGTDDIRRQAHDELSFVQKNTEVTLVVVGGIATVLIVFFWRQREKNQLVLQLMTRQIQELSGHQTYDEMLERLHNQAEQLGVQNQLQNALVRQGLPTKDSPKRARRAG